MSVKEVLEAVRNLSPEERAQVRALLDTLPDSPHPSDEEVQARLRAAGLLAESGQGRSASARTRRTPVEIKGEPLSQTVIEEPR